MHMYAHTNAHANTIVTLLYQPPVLSFAAKHISIIFTPSCKIHEITVNTHVHQLLTS